MAASALALVPFWWHFDLVDPGIQGIIAVFAEVAVYPSDVCLVALAVLAVRQPLALSPPKRWLVVGFALLAAVALLSARSARDPQLAAGLAGHLALLALAWSGLRSGHVSRVALAGGLVSSAAVQSLLAVAQFVVQQPLIPSALHLPWLPDDVSQGGTPVVLDAAGDRLLRGFGTFPHPNVLGGYLALALVCVPLLGQRWPRIMLGWWALGAVISLGLVASFSRAGCLAAVVGLGVWCQALSEISDHLPLGIGGGNYGLVAIAEGRQEGWGQPAPNVALLIAAELGLPGVLALAVLVVGTVRSLRMGDRGVDMPATVACIALVLLAMVDHYLWTMPLGQLIGWVPFALIAAQDDIPKAARGTPTLPRSERAP